MTMTNEEIASAVDLMSKLHETGRLGYAIAKNMQAMLGQYSKYTTLRDNLLSKYGTADNGKVTIPKENVQAFLDEIKEPSQSKNEISVYKVPEDVFYSGSLTSDQMVNLLWMVK